MEYAPLEHHLLHVLIVIIVIGYVFQQDFRHETNAFLQSLLEASTTLLQGLIQAQHPVALLLLITAFAAAIVVLYYAALYLSEAY